MSSEDFLIKLEESPIFLGCALFLYLVAGQAVLETPREQAKRIIASNKLAKHLVVFLYCVFSNTRITNVCYSLVVLFGFRTSFRIFSCSS